ncbi:MAG: PAS domain S-box protein [Acidobacteria bacterium]|jgi:PAS domain S-box-containing protein|nr:PAS domain S-box protein [Acidobacteriota bacterium]
MSESPDQGKLPAQGAPAPTEELFRAVVESAPNGVVMVDQSGVIVLVNRETERLFGYTRLELLGKSIDHLVPVRFRDQHPNERRDFFGNPHSRAMGAGRDLYGVRKDGTEIPVEIGLNPIATEGGMFVLASVVDISSRKAAEEELRQSNEELERFAYVASHDLQEPLRTVASYLQLLERRYRADLDDDAREFIDFAVAGARRMEQLIKDLLAFSRVGTQGGDIVPVDSDAVLKECIHILRAAIADSSATISGDTLPRVMADPSQLQQLLTNLIGNALKFRGDAPPLVHITARREGRFWRISIADNGIGIEPEYFERIFVIFQRLHSREAYPGTGVGLAICRKIVDRHGGRIWPESASGQGTTFHFTLPAAP